jgi:hypothetical protein
MGDRTGAAVITVGFLFIALTLALNRTFLHDEGLFTFPFARILFREFWATLFLHRTKPVLVLLYSLPSHFGLTPFFVVHSLVGGAAVYLTAATARALGIRHPNIAGCFLATSMIFVAGSSNGYPNTDGAAFLALFLFLHASKRRIPAAVVLGLLPLVRYELLPISVFFLAITAFRDRDYPSVLAAVALPVSYLAAGAVYNHDMLWMLSTHVNPGLLPAELRVWRPFGIRDVVTNFGRTFVANSPFLFIFAVFGVDRHNRRALLLFVLTVFVYLLLPLLQVTGWQVFGLSLRYHVAPLPLAALVVAWGFERAQRVAARAMSCARPEPDGPRRRGVLLRSLAPVAGLGIVAAAAGLLAVQLADKDNPERLNHRGLHGIISELAESGLYRGQAIYTDIVFAPYDECAGIKDAYVLVNSHIRWELSHIGKPSQMEAIRRALTEEHWLFDPRTLPLRGDALYIIRTHKRNEEWSDRLKSLGAVSIPRDFYEVYFAPQPGAVHPQPR